MNDKKHSRGGRNPHLRTSSKKPCPKCNQLVYHYSDGTISDHKVYKYETVKGVKRKTSQWHYCPQRKWN